MSIETTAVDPRLLANPIITHDDWMQLSVALQDHHALFDEMWQIGRPVFTEDIETAAVGFSESGEFLEFLFNPMFWNGLTQYERLFVISHECLHVILNHGVRTTNAKDRDKANRALDIVVNHLLVNSFGFDRSRIRDEDILCWTDTVFKNPNDASYTDTIPTNESYEYYYQMIPDSQVIEVFILDDHSKLGENFDKVIDKLDKRLSPDEKEAIKGIIKKHYQKNPNEHEDDRAGFGCGGWSFITVKKVTPKKKWESIIFKWSLKYLREGLDEHEQWARLARRFELLPQDILLPSEMEDESKDFDRIPVHLYMDTSGSCIKYKARFFRAALSLPKDRFDVRLFCFDTRVEETTLESGKIYGGGGTAFHIIEANIQKIIQKEKKGYPEGVFIITDGMGNNVNPEQPEKWHWFLTRTRTTFIPDKSKTYKLNDFE